MSWKRLAPEGLTIVVGILVAFGVDAGWQYRQDRVRESEILESLTSEFEANRAALARAHSNSSGQISALRHLLDSSPDSLRAMSPRDAAVFVGVFQHTVFQSTQAELEAVLASGQFGLIRDPNLRRALGGWRVLVASSQVQADAQLDFMVKVMDVAQGSGVLSALAADDPGLTSAWAELATRPEFRDAASASLLVRTSYLESDLPRLQSAVDSILPLLRAGSHFNNGSADIP